MRKSVPGKVIGAMSRDKGVRGSAGPSKAVSAKSGRINNVNPPKAKTTRKSR